MKKVVCLNVDVEGDHRSQSLCHPRNAFRPMVCLRPNNGFPFLAICSPSEIKKRTFGRKRLVIHLPRRAIAQAGVESGLQICFFRRCPPVLLCSIERDKINHLVVVNDVYELIHCFAPDFGRTMCFLEM